jgi:hypothetical protein
LSKRELLETKGVKIPPLGRVFYAKSGKVRKRKRGKEEKR